MYSFPNLEPVHCSMSSSNCCFLTCIQISQEAGKMVSYSHLFQNFPRFFVIHTVKSFNVVNEAEVDVFLEFSCFFSDPTDVDNLNSGSSAFSFFFFFFFYFTILYWFCHTSTCIRHGCACVSHPQPPSYLPPHPLPFLNSACTSGISQYLFC